MVFAKHNKKTLSNIRRQKRKLIRKLRRQGLMMAGNRRTPEGFWRYRFDGERYEFETWWFRTNERQLKPLGRMK